MTQIAPSSMPRAPAHGMPIAQPELSTEYLSFRLGEVSYAIDIVGVQEIRSHEPTTPLPNAPRGVVGVISLRGEIVTIVNLKALLRAGAEQPTAASVVIVTAVGNRMVGWVVDAVCDVIELKERDLRPAPRCYNVADRVIERLALLRTSEGEQMLVLVEVEALMRLSELPPIVGTSSDAKAS